MLDFDDKPTTGSFLIRDTRGPRLSVAGQAPGARLGLSAAGLPRRRRIGGAAARRLHLRIHARPGISQEDAEGPRDRTEPHDADLPPGPLDRSREDGLVFRRSPRACGRLRALREADRGRVSAGHDAPHPGRGSEDRFRAELGSGLVFPEDVFRRQGQHALHRRQPDAL